MRNGDQGWSLTGQERPLGEGTLPVTLPPSSVSKTPLELSDTTIGFFMDRAILHTGQFEYRMGHEQESPPALTNVSTAAGTEATVKLVSTGGSSVCSTSSALDSGKRSPARRPSRQIGSWPSDAQKATPASKFETGRLWQSTFEKAVLRL